MSKFFFVISDIWKSFCGEKGKYFILVIIKYCLVINIKILLDIFINEK